MRTEKVLKNVIIGVLCYVFTVLGGIVYRTVFIKTLGESYLGISSLMGSVINVLNLSELGLGSAIAFSLYKPLHDNDEHQIRQIILFFKKAYEVIGVCVLVFGVLFYRILPFFIKDSDVEGIGTIYFLFVAQTVASYWFLGYKSTLLIAGQQQYTVKLIQCGIRIVSYIVEIPILIRFKNYLLILILDFIFLLASNIIISYCTNVRYPFLKEQCSQKLSQNEKRTIFKNCYSLSLAKVCNVALDSTDNLVISKIIGTTVLGFFSNYTLISSNLKSLLSIIFTSMVASIGDYNVCKNENERYSLYRMLEISCISFYWELTMMYYMTIDHFIELIWGSQFIMNRTVPLVISLNLISHGLCYSLIMFRDASGLFWEVRYRNIVHAGLNVVFSVLFAYKFGVFGVVLATILTRVLTIYTLEPMLVYHKIVDKSCIEYYLRLVKNAIGFSACVVGGAKLKSLIPFGFCGTIMCATTGAIVSTIVILALNYKDFGWISLIGRIKELCLKKKNNYTTF